MLLHHKVYQVRYKMLFCPTYNQLTVQQTGTSLTITQLRIHRGINSSKSSKHNNRSSSMFIPINLLTSTVRSIQKCLCRKWLLLSFWVSHFTHVIVLHLLRWFWWCWRWWRLQVRVLRTTNSKACNSLYSCFCGHWSVCIIIKSEETKDINECRYLKGSLSCLYFMSANSICTGFPCPCLLVISVDLSQAIYVPPKCHYLTFR